MKIYSKDRRLSVKIFDDMSELDGCAAGVVFSYNVMRDEYYVVQLLITDTSGEINVEIDHLRERAMVYNGEGTDKFGTLFKQKIVASNKINPIYIGYDFDGMLAGEYKSTLHISGKHSTDISLTFNVGDESAVNHGYDDITTLARLNWLNSKRAINDELVAPFTAINQVSEQTYNILGRDISFDTGLELKQVDSYFDEGVNLTANIQARLLAHPTSLAVGEEIFSYSMIDTQLLSSNATFKVSGESERFTRDTVVTLSAEGHLEYWINITAKADCKAAVTMSVPYIADSAEYTMGMGTKGGKCKNIDTKWGDMRHDSLFVGKINIGTMVKFKAENYRNPLINIYYANLLIIKPTTTWDNDGLGAVTFTINDNIAMLCANTGEMAWNMGQTRQFRIAINITPYKFIDYKQQYSIRYYHSNRVHGAEYKHLGIAASKGLNYFNVHHGNELHPYINYPFTEVDRLKKFVESAKNRGIGVKLYYTTREMSNHTAEVFAFKSLGSEIIMQKKGQGLDIFNKREWLDKYFGEKVIQAWQVHYKRGAHKGDHDIAFIIQPDSRLDNYYIEGLAWLVENVGIKGIYIDDTSLDATTLRRAKKVLDKVGGLIDMHMWNHEEERAGDAACLNIYSDIVPFVDSLWIGEGFDCRRLGADYIFTEVSGLMLGNMSQMLEGGGDHHVGMIFGMNNRYGWSACNADKLYKVWDDFGIESAYMYGYWHSGNPIGNNNDNVKTTTYLSVSKALVASYNFSSKTEQFSYNIDVKKLGFTPTSVKMVYLDYCGKIVRKTVSLTGINKLKARTGVLFIIT